MEQLFADLNNICWEYPQYNPIEPVEVKEYYRLSAGQKRLYLLQQMDPCGTAYNMTSQWEFEGILDQNRLEEVFNKLIQRHEIFRTSFEIIADEPIQRIHKKVDFKIEIDAEVQQEGKSQGYIVRSFDLSRAPLLRVSLIKLPEKKFILLLDMHHIINDAVSQRILLKEFLALYAGEDLPALRIQYKDYAEWQNSREQKELMKRQESYWLQLFSGELPVLKLPGDYPGSAIQGFEGEQVGFILDAPETERLKEMAREADASYYIVILSIYTILLSKLSGQHDIIVGIPTIGRRYVGRQHIIGMFANTLAMRNYPEPSKVFSEFLIEVRNRTLEAYENQEYPLEELVAKLLARIDFSRNSLFNVMFIPQNPEKPEIRIPGLELKNVKLENPTTKFDLSLYVEEIGQELSFGVIFREKLFTQATITLIIEYFKTILSSILKNSGQTLADINIISEQRRAAILSQLNQDLENEAAPIMGDGIFQTRLQQSLLKFQDNIALEYGGSSVSYAELDRRSDIICRWILNRGITGNSFIGMLINHRLQLIITLLGIIKAGSVIVPLYPGYPTERLEDMIQVTGLKYIFIDQNNARRFKQGMDVEFIDPARFDFDTQEEKRNEDNPGTVLYNPGDPLYIHFTSGSTGEPKATLGKNRGLLHFISWEIKTLGISPGFHAAQFTIPGFDPFLRDVFAPLLAGGMVCIPKDEDIVRHSTQLTDYIEQRRISLIHCVTGLFRLIISSDPPPTYFRNLKYILLAGEKTNPSDLVEWYNTFGERVQLLNCYGPTETTMSKAYYYITPRDINRERIPVGKPLLGSRIIILDENRNLCATLLPGEICIRTPFGSCGYFNAPGLNREKYIANPFANDPGDLIYRSGDLGRVLADGNLDILGRTDRQVKIRGYRVEPGDIEHHLIKHPEIKDALVLVLGDENNDNYLCAYIIPRRSFTVSELREYLAQKLPDYMIPAYFVQMERFPLTARGKIDRGSLPEPGIEVGENIIVPADETEKKLLKIWSEVLRKEENKISVEANFFELGGHSLKAAALIAKIHKKFNVKVPMSKFFEISSVRTQAHYIKVAAPDKYNAIDPVEKKDYYPMSSAQKRMYILQEINPGSVNYNMPLFTVLEGPLEKARLEKAFRELIHRHESLRTSFQLLESKPVQRVWDKVNFEIEYYEGTAAAEIKKNFVRPFNLMRAPFLRVGLMKPGEENHILLVDMHHSISDGRSLEIFLAEILALYRGEKLPELRIQYKDFSEWLEKPVISGEFKKHELYWLNRLAGDLPVLKLPVDYPTPGIKNFDGALATFEVPRDTAKILRALARREGVTMFMVILTIFNILLFKLGRQDDIIVGTVVAGRSYPDLEYIIGMFVNTLVLRNYPRDNKTFIEFLREVKKTTLEAFDHQDYPFDDLVDKLGVKRDAARNPLFDVLFLFDSISKNEENKIEIPGLKINPYEEGSFQAKFDLFFTGTDNGESGNQFFTIKYSTQLFKKEKIERFITYFKEIVSAVKENETIALKNIGISHGLAALASVLDIREQSGFEF